MNQLRSNQPTHWKLEEAKARFSEVVRRAQRAPQKVTVRGKDAVVVISASAYEQMLPQSRVGLVDLLRHSPLASVEFDRESMPMPVRTVDL